MILLFCCWIPAVVSQPEVLFTATPDDVVEKALDIVALSKDDTVYDLGCGDGRVLIRAAGRPGCKGYGVDLDDDPLRLARAAIAEAKLEHLVKVEKQDMFATDLGPASVVYLYVLPSMLVKLRPQFARLRPGSRIISHDFPIKGYKPDKVVTYRAKSGYDHVLYMWIIPFQKEKP